jgi:hypothetical protein
VSGVTDTTSDMTWKTFAGQTPGRLFMDPITIAIVAALPALATDIVSSAVKDAYAGLKSIITHKFGATSAVSKSVEDLEANPKSKGQATLLSERVEEAKATSDTEIMAAVSKPTRTSRTTSPIP